MQMPSNGYVMMQMLLVGMSWCKCPFGACHDANAPCKDAMNAKARLGMQWMQMSPWEYAMMQMLWCKHNFFQKFLLFSKQGFFSAWNQNIFKIWFIIPEKSSSFWLKAPKNLVITVRNLRMGYWLRTWWSGSNEWHVFKAFFWKNEFFENQAS